MSECSLDSLENDSSFGTKVSTRLEKGCGRLHGNINDTREHKVNEPFVFDGATRKSYNDDGYSEWSVPMKFHGNALIASNESSSIEFYPTKEKAPVTHGGRSNFRVERNVAKKFDVPRRSLSSASEFRFRSTPFARKSPNDVNEGFMKFDKKLGNVQTPIADRGKKSVSYLDLYRRKFASVERSRRTGTPEGSTSSICDDRSDERLANVENLASVSRDDDLSELDFYRRVIELGSRETRETHSCETLDRSTVDEGVSKSTDDVASRCYSASIKPVNSRRRVSYKTYSIEDYRSLSVPQPDRSLGPDRIEIESKGERLMRRRSYGDSVSARNRQRILHCAQKLKQSGRADARKLPLSPLTDLQHPVPASKIVDTDERNERNSRPENPSRSRRRNNKKARENKNKVKTDRSSSVTDLYENSSDTIEESTHLRNLRQRHIDEKRRIDLLLKRGK